MAADTSKKTAGSKAVGKKTTGSKLPCGKEADVSESIEVVFSRIETLVCRMEEQNTSLEEAILSFEEGVSLAKTAQAILENAEQRVRILTDSEARGSDDNQDLPD